MKRYNCVWVGLYEIWRQFEFECNEGGMSLWSSGVTCIAHGRSCIMKISTRPTRIAMTRKITTQHFLEHTCCQIDVTGHFYWLPIGKAVVGLIDFEIKWVCTLTNIIQAVTAAKLKYWFLQMLIMIITLSHLYITLFVTTGRDFVSEQRSCADESPSTVSHCNRVELTLSTTELGSQTWVANLT